MIRKSLDRIWKTKLISRFTDFVLIKKRAKVKREKYENQLSENTNPNLKTYSDYIRDCIDTYIIEVWQFSFINNSIFYWKLNVGEKKKKKKLSKMTIEESLEDDK